MSLLDDAAFSRAQRYYDNLNDDAEVEAAYRAAEEEAEEEKREREARKLHADIIETVQKAAMSAGFWFKPDHAEQFFQTLEEEGFSIERIA